MFGLMNQSKVFKDHASIIVFWFGGGGYYNTCLFFVSLISIMLLRLISDRVSDFVVRNRIPNKSFLYVSFR